MDSSDYFDPFWVERGEGLAALGDGDAVQFHQLG
jgi:hypothetical protein